MRPERPAMQSVRLPRTNNSCKPKLGRGARNRLGFPSHLQIAGSWPLPIQNNQPPDCHTQWRSRIGTILAAMVPVNQRGSRRNGFAFSFTLIPAPTGLQLTVNTQSVILRNRIKRNRAQIRLLLQKMGCEICDIRVTGMDEGSESGSSRSETVESRTDSPPLPPVYCGTDYHA